MFRDGSFTQVINHFVQLIHELDFFLDFSNGVRNIASTNGLVQLVKDNLWVNFLEIQHSHLYHVAESILYLLSQAFGAEIVLVNIEVDTEETVVGKNNLK